ncbi:AAA family ATPase [Marinomonas sp.]|uniref:AAA family ATPase n=1 Tax=Marinomonas sp. TaxID=1904862 RepID=UPI003BA9BDE1
MKLVKVTVRSLFGVFDHEIPFNIESGITIVIGENGLGKTVILEAINALFDEKYSFFGSLEFERFDFYFSNNEIWKLTKESSQEGFSLFIGRDSLSKPVKKGRLYKIFQGYDANLHKMKIREMEIMRRLEMDRHYLNERSHNREDFDYDFALRHRRVLEREYRHRLLSEANESDAPQWFLDGIVKVKKIWGQMKNNP